MFDRKVISGAKVMLLAGVLASSISVSPVDAQSVAPAGKTPVVAAPYRFAPTHFSRREGEYYGVVWGVESLSVKLVESGEIIRFSFHVLDADNAKPLNDKKSEPSLI
jgi:hypothetical protein